MSRRGSGRSFGGRGGGFGRGGSGFGRPGTARVFPGSVSRGSSFRGSPYRSFGYRSSPSIRSYQPYLGSLGYRYPRAYAYPYYGFNTAPFYNYYNNYPYEFSDYGLWPSAVGQRGALVVDGTCVETTSSNPAVIGRPFFIGQSCADLAVQTAIPSAILAPTPTQLQDATVLAISGDGLSDADQAQLQQLQNVEQAQNNGVNTGIALGGVITLVLLLLAALALIRANKQPVTKRR